MKLRLLVLIVFPLLWIKAFAIKNPDKYKGVLTFVGTPQNATARQPHFFTDLGSWSGFSHSDSLNIAFRGPLLADYHLWAGKDWGNLSIPSTGTQIEIKKTYIPGLLSIEFRNSKIVGKADLFYLDANTIGIKYVLKGEMRDSIILSNILWEWTDFVKMANNVGWRVKDWFIIATGFTDQEKIGPTLINNKMFFKLNPSEKNETVIFLVTQIFHESEKENIKNDFSFESLEKAYQNNRSRWREYINLQLAKIKYKPENDTIQMIAVKSVCTLIHNWRAPLRDILHDGICPSVQVHYFNGFYSWDSWKHAVALANFAPELAKNQIRAMFDYQNEQGMVADCIERDKKYNNCRNTKPPLAAWAVYEVFKKTNDSLFVKEILPSLDEYHNWWYQYRDINRNGWCEYGSTDGTIEAAAWESGMDNAVRFDSSDIEQSSENAYSLMQESVDLNAFLIMEKRLLSKLWLITGDQEKSRMYLEQFKEKKNQFLAHFYDPAKQYFFDKTIMDNRFIKIFGPEAWIPLWAGLIPEAYSTGIIQRMMDEKYFNTHVPLPTLSRNNENFKPDGYWRGAVWLDQVYFGLSGLIRYGQREEARLLFKKFLKNAGGIKEKGVPLYENYNPLTGSPLKAPHFSWSGAHLLMILGEIDE